jgi:hypothetical protein
VRASEYGCKDVVLETLRFQPELNRGSYINGKGGIDNALLEATKNNQIDIVKILVT